MAATLFLLSLGCSARYVARICSRFMEAISLLPKSQPMPIFPLSSQSSAYTPPCLARIIQALIAAPPFCHWFHLIACSEMQLQAPDVHVLIGSAPHPCPLPLVPGRVMEHSQVWVPDLSVCCGRGTM